MLSKRHQHARFLVRGLLVALVGTAGLAGTARAQAPLTNGGFETLDDTFLGGVYGFTNNNAGSQAVSRSVGDGLNPTIPSPHGGERVIQLGPIAPVSFRSFNTDTAIYDIDGNQTFLDLPMDWNKGAITVSIWYNIPANNALGPVPVPPLGTGNPWPEGSAPFGIKMNIKGAGSGLQDNATVDPWGFVFGGNAVKAAASLVGGTTGGAWQQLTMTWKATEPDGSGWKDQVIYYSSPRDPNNPDDKRPYFSLPPTPGAKYPDRVKVVLGRYNPTNTPDSGRIYIDDMTYSQAPVACNKADITDGSGNGGPDGNLTASDVVTFFSNFFAPCTAPGAVPCNKADITDGSGLGAADGNLTGSDVVKFFSSFFSPCGA